MCFLDELQQFVLSIFSSIDICREREGQEGKRAQNRGDWQARDRRGKKCKKRPLSPPPCSCAALLLVASKPPCPKCPIPIVPSVVVSL